MAGGRPRSVAPAPEECTRLGKELLEWAKVEDPDQPRIRFAQWYSEKMSIPRKVWRALILTGEFVHYYECAQSYLANRVLNPKILDKSFGHRYIRLYDRELIEAENKQAKLDAEIKSMSFDQTKELIIQLMDYSQQKKDHSEE